MRVQQEAGDGAHCFDQRFLTNGPRPSAWWSASQCPGL